MSRFNYHAMNNEAKRKLEDTVIRNIMEHEQNNGRFLIVQSKAYRVAEDDEVKSKARSWFNLKNSNFPIFGSIVFDHFLEQNQWLNSKIIEFLDELYLSEFREPWTPGPGICGSVDAPYNTNHQMNIHRHSYLLQNYSREDTTIITAGDTTVYRWTYGTGSGLITHGIPKW